SLKHVMMRRYAVLNVWPIEWLGAISYSLYLWQQIFLDRGSASLWTAFPQNLLFSMLLASASYHGIEKPFLKVREQWTKARRPHLLLANSRQSEVLPGVAHPVRAVAQ